MNHRALIGQYDPWTFAVLNYVVCKQLDDDARHCGFSLTDGLKWEVACFGAQVQAWHDREIARIMREPQPPMLIDGNWYYFEPKERP